MLKKQMDVLFSWVLGEITPVIDNIIKEFGIGLMYLGTDGKKITIKLPKNTQELLEVNNAENFTFIIEISLNSEQEKYFKYFETVELEDNKEDKNDKPDKKFQEVERNVVMTSFVSSKNSDISLQKLIEKQIDFVSKKKPTVTAE